MERGAQLLLGRGAELRLVTSREIEVQLVRGPDVEGPAIHTIEVEPATHGRDHILCAPCDSQEVRAV